jgi:flagellar biosynthesis/type III secretory pathway protein FliH
LQKGTTTRVEVFQYPCIDNPPPLLWEDLPEIVAVSNSARDAGSRGESEDSETTEPESFSPSEEIERSFEAGREQGIREVRDKAVVEQQTLLQQAEKLRMEQAANLTDQFAIERERFLPTMEHQVVRLSLAIAARILRREAQMDPLFLTGAVRVALGQLAETMHVKLRVPTSEAELWVETLAHLPNLRTIPSVVPDDHMQLGDCFIETEIGSVDLGLRAQLKEAERALFQGSKVRPPANPMPQDSYGNEERM